LLSGERSPAVVLCQIRGPAFAALCLLVGWNLTQLAADTAALIAQLNPQPVDLRNPKVLHLKTDKQRARAIREGHSGTGMFPDTTMTNQALTDTLAYLAVLR
jgi:gamma-glutamyl:cysteine ligase YbdK (ATP-grasp superfamily)